MSLYYADAYLAPHAKPEREARALTDIRALGDFLPDWQARLQVLRVYIIICLESTNSPDDAFSAKLRQYQSEFTRTLSHARAAVANKDGSPAIFASIGMERS